MSRALTMIATYNGEKYLPELLNSIPQPVDILISDDGSTDNTLAVIESSGRENVQILPLQPQRSAAKNFSRLLNEASREYDYYLLADQDDVWPDDKYQKSLRLMHEKEAQFGVETPLLIFTDATVVDDRLAVMADSFWRYEQISPRHAEAFNRLVCQNVAQGATMMFNRALMVKLRTVPAEIHMHDWWLALFAFSFGHIIALEEPLLYYRQHCGNVVGARQRGLWQQLRSLLRGDSKVYGHLESVARQAAAFRQQYADRLDDEQRHFLDAFIRHRRSHRLTKMCFLLKNRVALTTPKRTFIFYLFY